MTSTLSESLSATVAIITAMGALGTAASGLVDATKAFGGGPSRFGFHRILQAVEPFRSALESASTSWLDTVRANWFNGVPTEDQKTAVKTLIRLGLSSKDVDAIAAAGHVDKDALASAMAKLETGQALTTADAQVFGRLNAMIDAAMDAGFERASQIYRNACKLLALVFALILAICAGWLAHGSPLVSWLQDQGTRSHGYWGSRLFWWACFAGVASVPIAPIAKDLASSLQAAAKAVAIPRA